MSERFGISGDNAEGALNLPEVDGFDAALEHALRLSLWEHEERQRERDEKEKARKRVREEAKLAEVAGRVVDPESEAEDTKQAFRKMKEEKIVISSDEEEEPVAAVGDGKGRAGVHNVGFSCVSYCTGPRR